MARKSIKRASGGDRGAAWISYSDMMAALLLLFVLVCLGVSVATNLGGSYMMRGIINDFIYSGCRDFGGLARAMVKLGVIYLFGCVAAYGQSATMVQLAQRGVRWSCMK